jgi:Superinfection immunity protein
METVGALVLVIVLLGIYLIPLIVALIRSVPNTGSVAVINILLGWTLVGWAVALAMACRSHPQPVIIQQVQPPYPPDRPQAGS